MGVTGNSKIPSEELQQAPGCTRWTGHHLGISVCTGKMGLPFSRGKGNKWDASFIHLSRFLSGAGCGPSNSRAGFARFEQDTHGLPVAYSCSQHPGAVPTHLLLRPGRFWRSQLMSHLQAVLSLSPCWVSSGWGQDFGLHLDTPAGLAQACCGPAADRCHPDGSWWSFIAKTLALHLSLWKDRERFSPAHSFRLMPQFFSS
jgi:hypothetical protein